jgi:hypothetical protein
MDLRLMLYIKSINKPFLDKIQIYSLGLTQFELRGQIKREFEGKALKWGAAPHPAKYKGFKLYLRKSCS